MKSITDETLKNFKLHLYEEEKSDNTVKKYMRDVSCFQKWLCGSELDKFTVLEYKKELCEKYAPKSTNSILSSLNALFVYMANCGLENISIRKLCSSTGLPIGSMYYWFKGGKDELFITVSEYGLKKALEALFEFIKNGTADYNTLINTILDETDKYRLHFRFIYQMAASPTYGKVLKQTSLNLKQAYIKKLSEYLKIDEEKLGTIMKLVICIIHDYIIWGNRQDAQNQINFIYFLAKTGRI